MSMKVLLASAARTATPTIADQSDPNAEGLHLIVNVSAASDTPSITPKIQGKGPLGTYYDLLVGVAMTGTGTQVLKLGPGIAPVPNGAAADYLPDTWRAVVTHGDADSITYSVTAVLAE